MGYMACDDQGAHVQSNYKLLPTTPACS